MAVIGWGVRRRVRWRDEFAKRLAELERAVARIEGILSVTFPRAAEKVREDEDETP